MQEQNSLNGKDGRRGTDGRRGVNGVIHATNGGNGTDGQSVFGGNYRNRRKYEYLLQSSLISRNGIFDFSSFLNRGGRDVTGN